MINSIIHALTTLLQKSSYLCLLAGVAIPYIAGVPHTKDDGNDHLMPVGGLLKPAYEALLSRKLFVTQADYARVVELPSPASMGEIAIAIYATQDKPDQVGITSTRAERNLWYAEFGEDPNFPREPAVKVVRCDATFPKSTAVIVSEAIKRMLGQSHPPTRTNLIILHGADIEFSIEDRKLSPVRGLLTPYARGKNGAALRRLTQLLEGYCQARSSERPDLATKIRTEAIRMGK